MICTLLAALQRLSVNPSLLKDWLILILRGRFISKCNFLERKELTASSSTLEMEIGFVVLFFSVVDTLKSMLVLVNSSWGISTYI